MNLLADTACHFMNNSLITERIVHAFCLWTLVHPSASVGLARFICTVKSRSNITEALTWNGETIVSPILRTERHESN